jgi:hypothetical protein
MSGYEDYLSIPFNELKPIDESYASEVLDCLADIDSGNAQPFEESPFEGSPFDEQFTKDVLDFLYDPDFLNAESFEGSFERSPMEFLGQSFEQPFVQTYVQANTLANASVNTSMSVSRNEFEEYFDSFDVEMEILDN